MSMTTASSQYFAQVADQWDSIRSGYFTEAVRAGAIRKAYLQSGMTVADIGAGTGFMSAGLAPLVRQVHVIDASPEMLAVARQNLAAFDNLVYHEAEGLSLPLPDNSLDAVFANMYLHHIPEPLEAIREIVRALKPGGRLVISDMDAHPYAWLKEEMADVWQGFERADIRKWFEEAGLVNVIVDCSGQSCCAESASEATPGDERRVQIDVFLAVGTKAVQGATEAVGAHYSAIAEGQIQGCGCSLPADNADATTSSDAGCCGTTNLVSLADITIGSTPIEDVFDPGYTPEERQAVPQEAAEISLGCGNPTAFATLRPGDVVLDIGSGGGIDAFLAARQVGTSGHVIGVDMTPAMLERARTSAVKAGLEKQVEFRQGQAEALPVDNASVDVIISNCVINLAPDKGKVFREAARVLKSGGRLEVSDMVTDKGFPPSLHASATDWGGCVYGALPEQEYVDLIAQAGFENIQVRRSTSGEINGVKLYSAQVSARKS